MTATVIHQPRVAWDGACAFVRVAADAGLPGLRRLRAASGSARGLRDLEDTRERVLANLVWTGGDRYCTDVEAGKWRVRLEDLLRPRPDLTGAVIELTAMVPRC